MKQTMMALLICMAAAIGQAQSIQMEKVVMAYYSGFEKHDWNGVAAQIAEGFTFTSPNNDDHIPIDQFKKKCWPSNQFFKTANYIKWGLSGNGLFLLVEITTTENKIVRNVDFYEFDVEGKIKSIEVFFGPGAWFPGNKN